MIDCISKPAPEVGAGAARPRLFRTESWLKAWAAVWPSNIASSSVPGETQWVYYPISLGRVFHFRSAAPAATSTHCLEGFATEYLCFATQESFADFFLSAEAAPWDQLYLRGLLDQGFESDWLQRYCQERGYELMRREDMPAYGVHTSNQTFDTYCANLGKSTRDRVLGGRRRLQKQGEFRKVNLWPDVDQFLQILNQFHRVRWGKPCFEGESEAFVRRLLDNIVQEGGRVDLSVVQLGGNCVSAMLDIELDGWVYNLQSGFSAQDFGRVSLGMVHFGLQIEQAFAASHCHYYDFLAGDGKSANYKASIANNTVSMGDYYVVRSNILKLAYRLNDLIKRNQNVRRFPG